MLTINPSRQFKKDLKTIRHDQRAIDEVDTVVTMLVEQKILPARYRDHALIGGEYDSYRECHVRPDLLLIYRVTKSILELYLLRVGTHSELNLY